MVYTEILLFILTHHGPTRSPASLPESAMRPGVARTQVSAGLPGSQHAYNPICPGYLDTELLSH